MQALVASMQALAVQLQPIFHVYKFIHHSSYMYSILIR